MFYTRLKAGTAYRINRNIVECKYSCRDALRRLETELIETLWNVNKINFELVEKLGKGINRNIVECKY